MRRSLRGTRGALVHDFDHGRPAETHRATAPWYGGARIATACAWRDRCYTPAVSVGDGPSLRHVSAVARALPRGAIPKLRARNCGNLQSGLRSAGSVGPSRLTAEPRSKGSTRWACLVFSGHPREGVDLVRLTVTRGRGSQHPAERAEDQPMRRRIAESDGRSFTRRSASRCSNTVAQGNSHTAAGHDRADLL